ncbi:MAG: hypothetical protein DWQ34_03145 [Planctomycetota bacterium]|nr:MAG: hypothetical protein DWQ34_03145 [Planctomycetota bacterium]REK28339.1 MAG: hypothetical protein DWQ41_06075 [Planctomycetota bacterium]REK38815.1 MAG: hypothetical protein DWQ45_02920 [Planctomycetota bacterium]
MSEYQFIAFRAVDRPLTQRELVYARQQSSRAEITRWHFENEYHFGDFRGSADGLLRHGYDVHLHYANFGVRKIAVRLPAGLPFPASVWSDYVRENGLTQKKDLKGKGGILTLDPFHEPGDLEDIWSPGEYLDDVVEIRNHLVAGDPRVLYLLWLCAANDQSASPDRNEPPVPGGLAECLDSCGALLEFFGLDPLILVAASEDAPALPAQEDLEQRVEAYVEAFSDRESKRLLRRLLVEDAAVVKAEMLAALRESEPRTDWPTVALGRSFAELLERTEVLCAEHDVQEQRQGEAAAQREAAKQERKRQDRMKLMVKAPQKWLREAEKLVAARGTRNYKAAAEILSDLREAVGGEEGAEITRMHAAHLAKKHPTLNHLKSSLRKYGLLE